MTRDALMTAEWNNKFSLGLGAMFVTYIVIALLTSVFSDGEAFTGLVMVGCLF